MSQSIERTAAGAGTRPAANAPSRAPGAAELLVAIRCLPPSGYEAALLRGASWAAAVARSWPFDSWQRNVWREVEATCRAMQTLLNWQSAGLVLPAPLVDDEAKTRAAWLASDPVKFGTETRR
jgi:hypothetical protein